MAICKSISFLETAAKLLNDSGKEDEAFYIQMVDWLKSIKQLPTSEESIIKALGLMTTYSCIILKKGMI